MSDTTRGLGILPGHWDWMQRTPTLDTRRAQVPEHTMPIRDTGIDLEFFPLPGDEVDPLPGDLPRDPGPARAVFTIAGLAALGYGLWRFYL